MQPRSVRWRTFQCGDELKKAELQRGTTRLCALQQPTGQWEHWHVRWKRSPQAASRLQTEKGIITHDTSGGNTPPWHDSCVLSAFSTWRAPAGVRPPLRGVCDRSTHANAIMGASVPLSSGRCLSVGLLQGLQLADGLDLGGVLLLLRQLLSSWPGLLSPAAAEAPEAATPPPAAPA